mmetsp:Transcript_24191/g.31391  ORF Transcript_24191/g.31391 Transcript_24191/m.31391 type:complete len:119 (+) Transcript_24191:81-437(+)
MANIFPSDSNYDYDANYNLDASDDDDHVQPHRPATNYAFTFFFFFFSYLLKFDSHTSYISLANKAKISLFLSVNHYSVYDHLLGNPKWTFPIFLAGYYKITNPPFHFVSNNILLSKKI